MVKGDAARAMTTAAGLGMSMIFEKNFREIQTIINLGGRCIQGRTSP